MISQTATRKQARSHVRVVVTHWPIDAREPHVVVHHGFANTFSAMAWIRQQRRSEDVCYEMLADRKESDL